MTSNPDLPTPAPTWWERSSPTARPITWLAGTGAVLVLASASVAASTRWDSVPIPARLGALLLVHALVVAISERGRHSVPAVARVLAYLGAVLAVPTAVSAVATAAGSWRACTLVSGLIGVGVLELQAWRWRAPWLKAAEVAAVTVAAVGAAALVGAPLGVAVGTISIGALMIGTERRAAALAAIAVLTPALAVATTMHVGPGTIAELGATGTDLRWAAPIAGLLSALTFGLLARRTRRGAYLLAAASSVVCSAVVGGLQFESTPTVRVSLIGAALIVAELAVMSRLLDRSSMATLAAVVDGAEMLAVYGALVAIAAPGEATVPLALLSAGWLLGVVRTPRRAVQREVPAVLAAASAVLSVVSSGLAWPAPLWVVLVELTMVAASTRSRRWSMTAALAAPIVLAYQLEASHVPCTTSAVVFLAIGVAMLGVLYSVKASFGPAHATAHLSLVLGASAIPSERIRFASVLVVGLVTVIAARFHRHGTLTVTGVLVMIAGVLGLFDGVDLGDQAIADLSAATIIGVLVLVERRARRHDRWGGARFLVPAWVGFWYVSISLLATTTDSRLAATIAVGALAVLIGTAQSCPAVTLAGAGVVALALTAATWDRLGGLPVWAWAMAGGITLLGAALAIEKRRSPVVPTAGSLQEGDEA